MFVDIRPHMLIIFGFMFIIAGLGSALLYQRPSEVGLNVFLFVVGVTSMIIGYLCLPREHKMYINNLFPNSRTTHESVVNIMSQETKDIEEKIRKWLLDEGYDVKKINDPKSHFSYGFTRIRDLHFFVLQLKNKIDSIVVFIFLGFGKEGSITLSNMSSDEREEIRGKIIVNLATIGCQYAFLPKETPDRVRLSKTIYYDGLSKHNFFETVDIVRRGFLIVSSTIRKELGVPTKETKSNRYIR